MYPYGTNNFKVWESKMISKIQMINFDDYVNKNKRKHNPKWLYIPDYPYRVLLVGGSGSAKTKRIFKFNEQSVRYWWNIFVC